MFVKIEYNRTNPTNVKEKIGASHISYRGQIVIPKKVKELLNASDGDYIIFYNEGNKITIIAGDISPKNL